MPRRRPASGFRSAAHRLATLVDNGQDDTGDGENGRFGDELSEKIIGSFIEVHRHLGPGLLESAYEQCVCHELSLHGISFERQLPVPVTYKGVRLDCGYRIDLVVANSLIVEIKAVERLLPFIKHRPSPT